MTALTYIGGGLLCIGWLGFLIMALSSKSEKNIQDKQPISISKARHRNLSKNDTPG
jgi:hypothetical protein